MKNNKNAKVSIKAKPSMEYGYFNQTFTTNRSSITGHWVLTLAPRSLHAVAGTTLSQAIILLLVRRRKEGGLGVGVW